jgi:glycosyltransferase involved in cell wall biosynthesis
MNGEIPFAERVLARRAVPGADRPFFSVAIPQYGRRRYLELALASIFAQTSKNFEIIVSDDCSKDDSNAVLPGVLEASGVPFRYYAQPKNLGYDGNVRFLLNVSRARYVIMLGNDDALASPDTLQELETALRGLGLPAVAFTNSTEYQTGELLRRAFHTSVIGSGPDAAVSVFRSFTFVSGLIFDCESAQRFETDRWDRSVFYQIYLASRIIACGGAVAAIDLPAIRKDISIDGSAAASKAGLLEHEGWSFAARESGIDSVMRVVLDAVLPAVPEAERSAWARRIVGQMLTTAYAHWLIEHRWLANWSLSVGLARGMWPRSYIKDIPDLSARDRLYLWSLYLGVTGFGLTAPVTLARKVGPVVARQLRERVQRGRLAGVVGGLS